ncbi:MAG: glycosyltransferase family 4 protein [Pyrinomonadaceae bacterium]|nr:glycosyltransferase family 4 protein [Pyrinomonadaceae bacterium]
MDKLSGTGKFTREFRRLRIRVAYDVSFLAGFFNHQDGQSGVYRTVEELLLELCKRDDIELRAVAASGEDPLLDVTNSALYIARQAGCQFDPALSGRFGLSEIYFRTFGSSSRVGDADFQAAGNYRARQYITRAVRKIDRPRLGLKHGGYDVFHSPFLKLPSRAVIGDIPRVLTVYDLIFLKNPEFMTPALVAFLQRIFESVDYERDWVICISEFTKQEFCDYSGMLPERVFVTPLAAADHFRPISNAERIADARQKYSIPNGNYFLALSALQPRKNFSHLIRCFCRLLLEQPHLDINLVIVGAPGWLYEEIFATGGTSSEFRNRITFTGFVANEDLSAVYSGATAFVFPSLYEGFGLTPLEAMQCGLPVITSNTTALPEVVGEAGLLVNPTDADSLCQAMFDILSKPDLRSELSRKGLLRSEKFSWASCAQKTVEAYKKISKA